jgi:hypothetical protein
MPHFKEAAAAMPSAQAIPMRDKKVIMAPQRMKERLLPHRDWYCSLQMTNHGVPM